MDHRQKDNPDAGFAALKALRALPRPVYGHAAGLPNHAIGQRHSHPWVQLSYAVEGLLQVTTAAGRYAAPPLFAVWIPAGMPHAVRCASNTEIRSLYIASAMLPAQGAACRVLVVTPLLRELVRAFGELPVEYDEGGPEGRLVAVLLDQLAAAREIGLTLPWPADRRLRKVCVYLHKNPECRKGLYDFSTQLGVSEKTVSRLFLQETGLTFRLWRQRSRLLASLPLLEQGMRVTDVALSCGYESMSAFTAAFREQMGATPRALFSGREEAGPE
ncbi:MAG TPA: helix-turn-helix transcriptional regulator [Noviherbaspirillum sp.]|jgi:AraC-like DNA-binding protein|uniref:AraC family transcriptional regulator n=1 Tax=Noviherbaspirillum sp. TaxID=1926288 RepID=UPI002F950DFF